MIQTLDEVIIPKADYADCVNCPLRDQPCVPSYRPENEISLIVVGEAPGYYEEKYEIPFYGTLPNELLPNGRKNNSGSLLGAVLKHIDIDPATVYRTNAVLCRPPQNDLDRYPDAVKACSERLRHELAAILTSTIAALGGTAVKALDALTGHTTKDGILKRRGQWYDAKVVTQNGDSNEYLITSKRYLATLHPAFVLRSAGYMAQFLTDMRSITIDRSKDWFKTSYYTVDGNDWLISDLAKWLDSCVDDKLRVSFDVETANLNPRSKLLALGLACTEDYAVIIPGDLIKNNLALQRLLTRFFQKANLTAQNGKFDQQVLKNNGIDWFNLSNDTMLAHYSLDEQPGTHGLKQLLSSFVGVPDYEAALVDKYFRNTKREDRDYSIIPTADLYKYLAIDCCGTLALDALLEPMIEADGVTNARKICVDASNALQHTEYEGIKVDVPYLQTVLVAVNEAIEIAEQKVQSEASVHATEFMNSRPSTSWTHIHGVSWIKTVDQYRLVVWKIIHGDKKNKGINLNSWQQLQVLLYDILQLKHTKKLGFKTDPRSTNQEALDALEYHPFVSVLQEHRRLAKIKGTYVEKLLELADDNDRVHVRYNIHGTETGRLSANDGLHGIPRPSDKWGQALRGSFIAKPNHKLVMCDYSGGELRIFAALSGEPFLLDMFANDEDPHGIITLMVFGDDPRFAGMTRDSWDKQKQEWVLPKISGYTYQDQKNYWKEQRTTGKNVVFGGLVYMGGASGICAMIRAQTGKIISQNIVSRVLSTTLAQMPIGQAWQRDQFRKARDQGFVQTRFGFKRRFMLITDDNLDEVKKASVNAPIQGSLSTLTMLSGIQLTSEGYNVLMYNHDQLMIEVPEHLAETAAKHVQSVMVNKALDYFPEVKWKADVEIGERWYDNRPSFKENYQ